MASPFLAGQTLVHPDQIPAPDRLSHQAHANSWSAVFPGALPTTDGWKGQTRAWESFLVTLWFHPATPAEERVCQCKRGDRSKEFGITAEEERVLMDTLYPVRLRIDQLRLAFHESISGANQVPHEEVIGRNEFFQKHQEDPILIAMIAQIKAGMSEQSFKNLDAFVYARSRAGEHELGRLGINPQTVKPIVLSESTKVVPQI